MSFSFRREGWLCWASPGVVPMLSLFWGSPGHPKGSRWGWDIWADPSGFCDPCEMSCSPKRSQEVSSRVGLILLGSLWCSVGQSQTGLAWKGPSSHSCSTPLPRAEGTFPQGRSQQISRALLGSSVPVPDPRASLALLGLPPAHP